MKREDLVTLARDTPRLDKKEKEVLIRTVFLTQAQFRMTVAQVLLASAVGAFFGLGVALLKEQLYLEFKAIALILGTVAVGLELLIAASYFWDRAHRCLDVLVNSIYLYHDELVLLEKVDSGSGER